MTYEHCPLAYDGNHRLTYDKLDNGLILIRCLWCGEKIK